MNKVLLGIVLGIFLISFTSAYTYDNFGDGVVNWSFWKNSSSYSAVNPYSYTETSNQLRIIADNNAGGTNIVWSELLICPLFIKSINTSLEWSLSCGNSCSSVGTLQLFNQTIFSIDGGENGLSGSTNIAIYGNPSGTFHVYNGSAFTTNITPSGRNVYISTSGSASSPYVRNFYLGTVTYETYGVWNNNTNVVNNTYLLNDFTIGINNTGILEMNLSNVTSYVYNSSNSIVDTDYSSLSGKDQSVNVTINLSKIGDYTWFARTCGTNGTYSTCYNSQNRSFISGYKQFTIFGGLTPTCTVSNGTLDSNYKYTPSGSNIYDTITCSLYGYDELVYGFSFLNGAETLTLTSNSLYLTFLHYNGSLANTGGYWADSNRTMNFTGTSLNINLTDMIQGRTNVYFGYNTSLLNYTQFYEFDNDWITSTYENLTIITTATNPVYIKIRDEAGNPINDALIRVTMSNPALGGVFKEIGQRFSGSEGISGLTYFNIPSDSEIQIRITKDGYNPKTITRNVQSDEYDALNPINVDLTRSSSSIYKGVFITTYTEYYNTLANIPIFVYAPSRSNVSYSTSFNNQNYSITLDTYKQGWGNMTRGLQYCDDCTNDLNVTFWVDGSNYRTITIKYVGYDETKFTEPNGQNSDFKMKMIWIALIGSVGILGFIFKSGEENIGSGKFGKGLFIIGSMVIPLVFLGEYIFLLIISIFFIIGEGIRKFISE